MTISQKSIIGILAICIGIVLIFSTVLDRRETRMIGAPIGSVPWRVPSGGAPAPAQSVLTPDYLMDHPEALQTAERQCAGSSGKNVVAVCDNVHSAQAGLLAQQYRNAAAIQKPQ